MIKIFVYGSLKPGGDNYPNFCQGKTIKETKSWIKGSLYDLNVGYPAIVPHPNNRVFGYLFYFPDCPEYLEALDLLEDYKPDSSCNNTYNRMKTKVYSMDNVLIDEAWAYYLNEKKLKYFNVTHIPSGWWEV